MMKKRSRSSWARPRTVRQVMKIMIVSFSLLLLFWYIAFSPVWGRGPKGVGRSSSHSNKVAGNSPPKPSAENGLDQLAPILLSEVAEAVDGVTHFRNCPALSSDYEDKEKADLSYNSELVSSLVHNITRVKLLELTLALQEAGYNTSLRVSVKGDEGHSALKSLLSVAHTSFDPQLFAIWPGAMKHMDRIIKDISQKFIILRIAKIDWTQKGTSPLADVDEDAKPPLQQLSSEAKFLYFEENLWRLYSGKGGVKRSTMKMKVSQCGGVGPFVALLVIDPNPQYEEEVTAHGSDYVNKNMFLAKKLYRKWSGEGGFKVHGTYSSLEAEHDARVLFGQRPLSIVSEALGIGGTSQGMGSGIRGLADSFLIDLKKDLASASSSASGAGECTTTSIGTAGFPRMAEYFTAHTRPIGPPQPTMPDIPNDPNLLKMLPEAEQNRVLERYRDKEKSARKRSGKGGSSPNIAEIDGALAVGDLFVDPIAHRVAPLFNPIVIPAVLSNSRDAQRVEASGEKTYQQIPNEMEWTSCDALWFAIAASSSTVTAPSDGSITPFYPPKSDLAADQLASSPKALEQLSFYIVGTSQPHPSGTHRYLSVPFDWRIEDRRRLARNSFNSSTLNDKIPLHIQRCARVTTYVSPERIQSQVRAGRPGKQSTTAEQPSPYNFAFSALSPISIPTTIPIFALDDNEDTKGRAKCRYDHQGGIPNDRGDGSSIFDDERIVAWTMNLVIRPPTPSSANGNSKEATVKANRKLLASALNNLISSTYGTVLSSEGREIVVRASTLPFPMDVFVDAMDGRATKKRNQEQQLNDEAGAVKEDSESRKRKLDREAAERQRIQSERFQSLPAFNTAPSLAIRMNILAKLATSRCNMGRGLVGIVRAYGVQLAAQRSQMQIRIDEGLNALLPASADALSMRKRNSFAKGTFKFQRSEEDLFAPPPPPPPFGAPQAADAFGDRKKGKKDAAEGGPAPIIPSDYFSYWDARSLFERSEEQSSMGDSVRCDGGMSVMVAVSIKDIGRVFIDVCMQL